MLRTSRTLSVQRKMTFGNISRWVFLFREMVPRVLSLAESGSVGTTWDKGVVVLLWASTLTSILGSYQDNDLEDQA